MKNKLDVLVAIRDITSLYIIILLEKVIAYLALHIAQIVYQLIMIQFLILAILVEEVITNLILILAYVHIHSHVEEVA